jgi:hypothetical protein
MAIRDIVQAAAGVGGAGPNVEEVFSTYLYTGTGSARSINNGIDLSGEGGLVWIKRRDAAYVHQFIDTNRGVFNALFSNSTSSQVSLTDGLTSFNSNGFSLGTHASYNENAATQVSWTFRKAPKFFDVVTWTGNGVAGREIAHSLGSVPGCVIIKCTSTITSWQVYHIGAPTGSLVLQSTAALDTVSAKYYFGDDTSIIAPTSTNFTVGGSYAGSQVNGSGATYVAYLFAHDAGGFGDDGEQNVISCGLGTGSTVTTLGYEPQWVITKKVSTGSWFITDVMRGMTVAADQYLAADSSAAELTANSYISPLATGFSVTAHTADFIYIAIRRPMKTPAAGTEVFASATATGYPRYISNFPVDMYFQSTISGGDTNMASRLTGSQYLSTNLTNVGITSAAYTFDSMVGVGSNNTNSNLYARMFKRAPGFMDVVCFSGTGSARTVAHNLGVVPELIIQKTRAGEVRQWFAHAVNAVSSSTHANWWRNYGVLNGTAKFTDLGSDIGLSAAPTATTLSYGTYGAMNGSGYTYVLYLFATLAGVSKVGSYTGTGADLNVDCGFSAGARFILIKRTDSTGDWYVWDSVRGIVAGNDPYLLLNSSSAEVTNTDYIDPLASGFTVTSTAPAALNASGGTYIFFSVA